MRVVEDSHKGQASHARAVVDAAQALYDFHATNKYTTGDLHAILRELLDTLTVYRECPHCRVSEEN